MTAPRRGDRLASADDTLEVVRDALGIVCGREVGAITSATSLGEIGVDSLARVALAEIVEERLAPRLPDLHIPDDDLAAFDTVGDVVGYLATRL